MPTGFAATVATGERRGDDNFGDAAGITTAAVGRATVAGGAAAAGAVEVLPGGGQLAGSGDPVSPARWGWRGAVNRLSGGRAKLGPGGDESQARAAQARVLTTFADTKTVVVANPKGGAGKTPVTLLLAATFGFYRGGYTLAWDNNETRGTLGRRAELGPNTEADNVIGLLSEIDTFLSTAASVGRLGAFVQPQSAHFDVLASDETPGSMDTIDGIAFAKLRQALSRFYRLIVIDTGNNVRARNWWVATQTADCLVVPTTVQADAGDTGLWMLDHLYRLGRKDLVSNAVAVVTCADRRVDEAMLAQILWHYRQYVREVVVVPFDPHIQPGTRISYRQLAWPTRRAFLKVAAAVIDALAAKEPVRGGGDDR